MSLWVWWLELKKGGCSLPSGTALVPRYAITVWYFDAKERAAAKDKYQLGTCFPNSVPSLKSFLFHDFTRP